MDQVELSIDVVPPRIVANLDSVKARVAQLAQPYLEARYDLTDPESIKDAKRDRSEIKKLADSIDAYRKSVKREYLLPLQEFEAEVNSVKSIADDAVANIKEQLDEAETKRRDARFKALEKHYEEFCPMLVPMVPFTRLLERQWLNKSFGEKKAMDALDEKALNLKKAWDALRAQNNIECYDVAERELFDSFDLSSALAAASAAAERNRQLAALKEEVVLPEPEPAPAPIPDPVIPPLSDERGQETFKWVMEIDSATVGQVRMIGDFCKALCPAVTGRFRKVVE